LIQPPIAKLLKGPDANVRVESKEYNEWYDEGSISCAWATPTFLVLQERDLFLESARQQMEPKRFERLFAGLSGQLGHH
jgi:hypothetical protein